MCFHYQVSQVLTQYICVDINQSSFHFFLTSADKIFYNQNFFTSGYRQDKKPKLARCFLLFTMIKPGTFTSISLPTSALLENHPGYISTAECSHAPKQPYTHVIQAFWLQSPKLFSSGPSLFSCQFPKFLQGRTNFNQVKTFHDVFSPIVSMLALETHCLRKGAVFTCPIKPRHIVGTSA